MSLFWLRDRIAKLKPCQINVLAEIAKFNARQIFLLYDNNVQTTVLFTKPPSPFLYQIPQTLYCFSTATCYCSKLLTLTLQSYTYLKSCPLFKQSWEKVRNSLAVREDSPNGWNCFLQVWTVCCQPQTGSQGRYIMLMNERLGNIGTRKAGR